MEKEKYLKSLRTRQLISILASTRKNYGIHNRYHHGVLTEVTYDELKRELSTREHIPSKAEGKRNRKQMAKHKR